MHKYGMKDGTTLDLDMVVSILPLAITNAGAAADAKIQYPPALMAASGTITPFVNIDDQQVKNDVFPSSSDLAPSLDNTVTIDGWLIVSILSLVKPEVKRAEAKDITDVAWLCENRLNDVTAIASQIDYQSRLSFASDANASNSAYFDVIRQGLQLDPSQVPSQ